MKKLNYLYKSIMNELNNATLKAPNEDLGIDLIGSTDTTIPAYLRQGRNQVQNEVRSQYPVSSDWNAQSNADLAAAELARLQQARETYANDPMHLYARSVSQDDVDLAAARAAGHAANAQATSTARDNQATAMRIYDQGLARERARQINPGVVGPLLDKQIEDRGATVTPKRRMPDGTLVHVDYEPRPKLSLDGELSPGVEDELLARIYPDHPDSIAYRKGTKTASVANILLLSAIKNSNLKNTTKSFLASLLKTK